MFYFCIVTSLLSVLAIATPLKMSLNADIHQGAV